MIDKEELFSGALTQFDTQATWRTQEIKKIILNTIPSKCAMKIPDEFIVGDMCTIVLHKISHPAVIFKIEGDVYYCIIMSSNSETGDYHNILAIKNSRFFKDANFTKTVVPIKLDQLLKSYIGYFDSPKELKKAVKLLRKEYKKIFYKQKKLKNEKSTQGFGEESQQEILQS